MTAPLIDTHAHLTDKDLLCQLDDVLERAARDAVSAVVCVASGPDDCGVVDGLARRYRGVFAAGGIHPHSAGRGDDLAWLRDYLAGEKWLAVGETGLDYHYDFADRGNQRRLFARHLAIARELGLPVIVHCREAFDDVLAIVKEAGSNVRGVFHSFTGTVEQAGRIVDLGWYVSFNGIMTFRKSDELRRMAALVPLDRILVETDAPYLSPEPVRKHRPNQPANVTHVADALARVRQIDREKLLEHLWSNALTLFGHALEGAIE